MAINAKKRTAKKTAEESPKKLKVEAVETPTTKQAKKTPKKAAQNGSATPKSQKGKKTATSNGKSPAKKVGKGKKSVELTPEQLENKKKAEQKWKQLVSTYLNKWETDKSAWKFNKNIQSWLIVNVFNPEKVDDKSFETAVSYFEGSAGFARSRILECAVNTVKKLEENKEPGDEVQERMDRAQRIAKIGAEASKVKETPKKTKGKVAAEKTPKAKTPKSAKKGKKNAGKKTEEVDEDSD